MNEDVGLVVEDFRIAEIVKVFEVVDMFVLPTEAMKTADGRIMPSSHPDVGFESL